MMDKELWYTQSGVKDLSYSLLPNARIPFHWPDGGRKAAREISIRLGSLWAWYPQLPCLLVFFSVVCRCNILSLFRSGSFAIDRVGEQVVKHRHRHGDVSLTRVEVRAEQGTHFVLFYPEVSVPPYSIQNYTPYTLTIYQKVFACLPSCHTQLTPLLGRRSAAKTGTI